MFCGGGGGEKGVCLTCLSDNGWVNLVVVEAMLCFFQWRKGKNEGGIGFNPSCGPNFLDGPKNFLCQQNDDILS